MKGLVLAGGTGTRLQPVTGSVSKHLLPVYDKPMIFYPLSVLMLAGIREIAIITNPEDQAQYRRLLGDGGGYGIRLSYLTQPRAEGLAQALTIGEAFTGRETVCLVLGDNIFYGQNFTPVLRDAAALTLGARLFGYQVKDPSRFGVVEFDDDMQVLSLEEKPERAKSHFAVTGLYFYDRHAASIAREVAPSERGELEINSVNQAYLARGQLTVELLGRGFAWFDCGTHESLLGAAQFVQTVETRQGFKIACLEEIGWRNGWLEDADLHAAGMAMANTEYGEYLAQLPGTERAIRM